MSKYEVDDFVTPPDPDLICCICRNVLHKPLESPCQHVFCKVCITTWLREHRSCPSCRELLSNSRLKSVLPIVRNMINRLLIKCKNFSNGCNKGVKLEVYERHVKECEYALVGCLNSGCTKNILRKDMLKHEKECIYRLVKCKKGCGLPVTVAGMREHNCVQSLRNSMQAMEESFNKRLKDLEDRLRNAYEALENRVYRMEGEMDDYREPDRDNGTDRNRYSYSRSRSRSRDSDRSRSYSRSYSRSRSRSYSHSRSRSRSRSPSYGRDSHSRSWSYSPNRIQRESPLNPVQDEWAQDDESPSWEYSDDYERDRSPWYDDDGPGHSDYSSDWDWRHPAPYPELPPPYADQENNRASTFSYSQQPTQTTNSSGQVANQQQARADPSVAGPSFASQSTSSRQSIPDTPESPPSRVNSRRSAAGVVSPLIISRRTVAADTPESPPAGERSGAAASNEQDTQPRVRDWTVAGSLYGVTVGDTDSEDAEWQPESDTLSSDSFPTSTEDADDDGRDLSGNEIANEPSTSDGRTMRSSTKCKQPGAASENQSTDMPGTSGLSVSGDTAESSRQRNESRNADQRQRSRRRQRSSRSRDSSASEEGQGDRRSTKRARKK